jgi:hypothetical protein
MEVALNDLLGPIPFLQKDNFVVEGSSNKNKYYQISK